MSRRDSRRHTGRRRAAALALGACLGAATVARADLLVASRGSDQVLRFDDAGNLLQVFADPALVRPVGLTFGPDGNVYVAAGDTDHVVRFDAATGEFLGVFTQGASLLSPRNVNFGPDGAFYVADGFLDQILRFDGTSGVFDRVFVQDPALDGPTSFTFGPDGDLYAVSVNTNRVLRFDGSTGAFVGEFAAFGLSQPHDVSFGPDGNLYVTNSRTGIVHRYRGDTGEPLGPFVTDVALQNPLGMAWGPDGRLYVANQGGHEIRAYDGSSGAPSGIVVAAGTGGLSAPAFLAFAPAPSMTLAVTPDPARGVVRFAVQGARPGARTLLVHGTPGGTGQIPECPGLDLGVGDPGVLLARSADESGNVVADLQSAAAGTAVGFVAVDAARCLASPPVEITLP